MATNKKGNGKALTSLFENIDEKGFVVSVLKEEIGEYTHPRTYFQHLIESQGRSQSIHYTLCRIFIIKKMLA